MSRGKPSLFDDISEAASGAGSEAMAAIKNVGGGDAGGTVGRLVSAVAGRHGGFAPKVITSVTKHGIAGIERVEPLENVDRGYRAVAADANGLESIRTIIELDPREYDVTVTREEGAGVVEFVQQPKPEPESKSVEPSPPVKRDDAADAAAGTGRPTRRPTASVEERAGAAPVRSGASRRDEVAEARAEAEKAKAEAEAEKARAEAETARAEADAAKARARTERARAESRADESSPQSASSDTGGQPPAIAESDGGVAAGESAAGRNRSQSEAPGGAGRTTPTATVANGQSRDGRTEAAGTVEAADTTDATFGSIPVAGGADDAGGNGPDRVEPSRNAETTHRSNDVGNEATAGASTATAGATAADDAEKWGLPDDAGAESASSTTAVESVDAENGVTSPNAPLRTEEPLETETVDGNDGEAPTVVDDEFGSFVAADPVGDDATADDDTTVEEGSGDETAATDEGIGRWAGETSDDAEEDTGGFEF